MATTTLGNVAVVRPSLAQRFADFWRRFATTDEYSNFGRDLWLFHARGF